MKNKTKNLNVWNQCGGKSIFSLKKALRTATWEHRIIREYWGVRK